MEEKIFNQPTLVLPYQGGKQRMFPLIRGNERGFRKKHRELKYA